jgi:aarF domain-containing kinase
MKNFKHGLLSRGSTLLKTSIKMGLGKDIDGVINDLSELKGLPQKVGQLISIDATDFLPPEWKDKFKPLQKDGKAIDFNLIEDILKNELGDKYKEIESLSKTPIGVGSIAQVHIAKIQNKDYVLKVQYPHISETIKTDIKLLSSLGNIFGLIRPKANDIKNIVEEAQKMLLYEIDYKNEKKHYQEMRELLKEDNRFYIPEILEQFSTEKVLCIEYIPGITLADWLSKSQDDHDKKRIVLSLLELFIDEFFLYGLVQTDPNYANYLIMENGQIALIDFGACKKFDPAFQKKYFNFLKSAYEKDKELALDLGEEMGLVSRLDSVESQQHFLDFIFCSLSFFDINQNPISFKSESKTKELIEYGWKLWSKQKISDPDSNLLFLHRKVGGMFSLLKETKLTLNLNPLWIQIQANSNRS